MEKIKLNSQKIERVSAGSFDLNKWLYGGYETGVITMIVGPPASGKTNFVLLAACSMAKKGKRVIFIDTEGGFSVERVKQIGGEEYEKILSNILVLNLTNFEDQKKVFSTLSSKVKREDIGMIIVDGISMLYRLELGDIKKDGSESIREINKEVAKQMRILSEISRKENLPVLITNQVYYDFLPEENWKRGATREMNIVGGDLFKYWSKTIIELRNDNGKRKAILLKHRSMPRKELDFEIKEKGVFRKGWF
ncbi:MAG: DNA repair and recombination protein RadB [Candidatus Pacearchaeota archaeon]